MITESGQELLEKEAFIGTAARALGTVSRAVGSSRTLAPAVSKLKKGWSAVKGSHLGTYAKNKVQGSGVWKAGVKDFNTPAMRKRYKALSSKYRAARSGPRPGASAVTKTAAEESLQLKLRRAAGLSGGKDANTRLMGIGGAAAGTALALNHVLDGASAKRAVMTRGVPTLAASLALGMSADHVRARARKRAEEERRAVSRNSK